MIKENCGKSTSCFMQTQVLSKLLYSLSQQKILLTKMSREYEQLFVKWPLKLKTQRLMLVSTRI